MSLSLRSKLISAFLLLAIVPMFSVVIFFISNFVSYSSEIVSASVQNVEDQTKQVLETGVNAEKFKVLSFLYHHKLFFYNFCIKNKENESYKTSNLFIISCYYCFFWV